ncbi:hypothetical protein GGX14DRAFT_553443 [Mycena pura]|uniref:Uncharacterized protein n=1 Tax=Mycena pura TaxID=153505 RepID=A0AAD7E5F7_9AGAR|nr:hypothetical protein GGX14DRAFT_553443 [Mycena pura]
MSTTYTVYKSLMWQFFHNFWLHLLATARDTNAGDCLAIISSLLFFTPEERAQSCRDKNTKYRQSEHGKAVRAQGHATDKRGRRKVAKGHLTRVPPLPSGIEEWTRASLHPEHPIHISARTDTEDFDASSIYHFLAPPPFDIPESEREAARTPQPYHRGGTVWLRQRALDGCLERERVKK